MASTPEDPWTDPRAQLPTLAAANGALLDPDDSPGPATPPGGVPAIPADFKLPRIPASSAVALHWVGAHGGAGVDTLAELIVGSRPMGRAWPLTPGGRAATVLVARTHYRGLEALRDAVVDWAWRDPRTGRESLPTVRLLGVALIADAPGKLPRELANLRDVITPGITEHGGHVWHLPWVEEWRLGHTPTLGAAPKQYDQMSQKLTKLVPALRGGLLHPSSNGSPS